MFAPVLPKCSVANAIRFTVILSQDEYRRQHECVNNYRCIETAPGFATKLELARQGDSSLIRRVIAGPLQSSGLPRCCSGNISHQCLERLIGELWRSPSGLQTHLAGEETANPSRSPPSNRAPRHCRGPDLDEHTEMGVGSGPDFDQSTLLVALHRPPQRLTTAADVVRPVRMQFSGTAAPSARLGPNLGHVVDEWLEHHAVVPVRPSQEERQGNLLPINDQMPFRAQLRHPPRCRNARAIHARRLPVDLPRGAQLNQEGSVQSVPDPGFLPVLQPPPAGAPTPAAPSIGRLPRGYWS